MKKVVCGRSVTKKIRKDATFESANLIREAIFKLIQKDYPDFNRDCYINKNQVEKYRNIHLENLISKADKDDYRLNRNVIDNILKKQIISDNIEDDLNENLSFGQRIADKVAQFGGSWAFIISFTIFLILWMATNVWLLASHPFDPYPFILLNLFLSTLAAIQAPVIMMSQNRQEEKDRKRGENDYKVNLKAELEIKLLHDKIDHIITYQNEKIMEILELNSDYLEQIRELLKKEQEDKGK